MWDKLQEMMLKWPLLFVIFCLISGAFLSIVQLFYELLFPKQDKEKKIVMYCEKYLKWTEEKGTIVAIYPIAFIGKYFLEYVPVVIILLEYIFIFWLFKFPLELSVDAILAEFLLITTGVFCAFKTTKFLISLYDSFHRKMPTFVFEQKQPGWDKVGYIFSLLIIVVWIIAALLDENSLMSGLLRWVHEGLSEMSGLSVFLVITVLACITYKHIQASLIQQEKNRKKNERRGGPLKKRHRKQLKRK